MMNMKNSTVKRRVLFLMILLCMTVLTVGLSGCESEEKTEKNSASYTDTTTSEDGEIPVISGELFAMDTYMTLTCYGDRCEEALEAATEEIQRLDSLLSVGNSDSEISGINENGSGSVSEDTAAMLEKALDIYEKSQGAFDITIYPMMELWGFTTDEFAVPSQKSIEHLLPLVDSSLVQFDRENSQVSIEKGQGIDLGGIAKGFTSTRIMEIFKEYDLVSGMISLGGNVQCYKTKTDGSNWRCGIKNPIEPDDSASMLGIIEIADEAVITSGAYERYFTDETTGKTYHHIIDPSTGYSAEKGIISSTIVSPDGCLADAMSTSCYIMGLEKSIDYWRSYGSDFQMILMTEDQEVYITEGLQERFSSDYPVTVISQEG